MDKQTIFNQVKAHLLKQNEQSRQPSLPSSFGEIQGVCAYRGEGGKMCAVGCLIKDEFYSPLLENKVCSHEDVVESLSQSLAGGLPLNKETISLLFDLQGVHDSSGVDIWPEALARVAINHKLKP